MIGQPLIRDRGVVPRKLQSQHNKASKSAWHDAGVEFHTNYRDRRFTEAHASEAGFYRRKPRYEATKERRFGHRRPLEFSGETRALVRTAVISSTSKGAKVRYPGARKLNFKNPNSRIRPNIEFRHVIPREELELAQFYDRRYDAGMNEGN